MIVPKAEERHAWISRAAAGLASVSNVLCLPAMLCQCIFRVWGDPLPGPQQVGGLLQGSRERLCVFLGWVVQPRGRGKAVELAGLRLMENSRASSKEDPLRGWSGAEGGVGTVRGWLEWGEAGWKVPRVALARRNPNRRELFQASTGSWRQGQGQASSGLRDKHKQLPSLGLLLVISAPDMQTLRGPPPLPPSPQLGEGWPGCLMKCRAAWESKGDKKRLCSRFCASGFLWPSLPAG